MSDAYEVVIRPTDGYDEEHAKLLRKRLFAEGFYDDVVSIRRIDSRGAEVSADE